MSNVFLKMRYQELNAVYYGLPHAHMFNFLFNKYFWSYYSFGSSLLDTENATGNKTGKATGVRKYIV